MWVADKPKRLNQPVAVLKSEWSGISVEYYTNLVGVQVYSCYWMNGAIKIKSTQVLPGGDSNGNVESSGCVARKRRTETIESISKLFTPETDISKCSSIC